MRYADIELMNVSSSDKMHAIQRARNQHFINNLRPRPGEFVPFDCKVRGNIGETFFYNYLQTYGIPIVSHNTIFNGNSIDMDFVISDHNGNNVIIEVKTSMVPDRYISLHNTIDVEDSDIKIIKRPSDNNDFHNISADIMVQIYYDKLRQQRDNYLSNIPQSISNCSDVELYQILDLDNLNGYLTAWIERSSLNSFLNNLPLNNRTWSYGYRSFWRCPLSIAHPPCDLPGYLQSI